MDSLLSVLMVLHEIPKEYDIHKIVHALLKELTKGSPPHIEEGDANRIIEKGNPNP
jgi:hypothetical protein